MEEQIFLKSTIIGYSYEQWKNDPETLASWFFCAFESWIIENFHPTGEFIIEHPEEVRKKYGEVKAACIAFENDIHSLSIGYHQMISTMNDERIEGGLKILYLGNLVENYITNIRTIYDLLGVISRISVSDHKYLKLKKVSTDSLNEMLKGIKDNYEQSITIFTQPVVDVLNELRSSLEIIRNIRNAIIHDGKEPIVTIKCGIPYFRIPRNNNNHNESILPDLLKLNTLDFPLLPYLNHLTTGLLGHMNDLGQVLIKNAITRDANYKCQLICLGGICMPEFLKFVNEDFSDTNNTIKIDTC